jgi:hypothetical protein
MAAPPAKAEISAPFPTPSNATMRIGMGKFWDYAIGLLGATGNAADARVALGIGLQASALTLVGSNITLTAAAAGATIVGNSGTPYTVTNPLANAVPAGARIEFFNPLVGVMTVACQGTDTLAVGGSFPASITIAQGDSLTIESNGGGAWYAVGGSAQLPYSSAIPGRLINVQIITASGTYTPTSGMKTVIAEGVGGGGGGGGTAATTSNLACGAGGASGSYGKGRFTAAQIGASQAVTIGAAGAGGAAGANNGGAGGTTSLGALLSCPGGGGGSGCTAATSVTAVGGVPGAGVAGANIVAIRGTRGSHGLGQGGTPAGSVAGDGAPSPLGGGGGGYATGSVAGAAQAYGAGGSGSQSVGTDVARAGGAGGGGAIIVYEYA